MNTANQKPIFFAKPDQFRAWLKKHHATRTEQWVGFFRKASGRPSITWPESVDEALCFGWIDGLRKGIDAESYKIRFTPRRATSTWSAINTRRIQELVQEGRVTPAGLAAFQRRTANKTGIYAYENRKAAVLSRAAQRTFRGNRAAWKWFQEQPAGYKQTAIWWVVNAKRAVTQSSRLKTLISDSAAKRKLAQLRTATGR